MISYRFKLLLPVGGAVIVAGVSGYIFYRLFLKDEEEDEIPLQPPSVPLKVLEIKVPSDIVGVIIGRKGSRIKNISFLTNTSINFRDGDGKERYCIIKGTPENVAAAEKLIKEAIEDAPEIKFEDVNVPIEAVGRIIGQGGHTIQNISRLSGAKITVCNSFEEDNVAFETDVLERKITLKGTIPQIQTAKQAIFNKVAETKEMREKIKNSAKNISHRPKNRESLLNNNEDRNVSVENNLTNLENTLPSGSDRFHEACVSAVDTAGHFWLQVFGPGLTELDSLTVNMTEYYSNSENRELHTVENVNIGDIVAVFIACDNKWYRGRIVEHDENDDPSKHVIYFPDFGDCDNVDPTDICELRTDFLKLKFQAIECMLSDIDQSSVKSEAAFEAFQDLTYAMEGQPMMVKVMEYRHIPDAIPFVRVIDTRGSEDIDVAMELVKRGLAQWEKKDVSEVSVVEAETTSES